MPPRQFTEFVVNILVTCHALPAKLSIKIEEFCISHARVLVSHGVLIRSGERWFRKSSYHLGQNSNCHSSPRDMPNRALSSSTMTLISQTDSMDREPHSPSSPRNLQASSPISQTIRHQHIIPIPLPLRPKIITNPLTKPSPSSPITPSLTQTAYPPIKFANIISVVNRSPTTAI